MIRSLLIGFLCLSLSALHAQSSLQNRLDRLAGLVGKVQIRKDVYDQSLAYDADAPYRITLYVTEVDSRGRESQQKFRVNLGLLSEKRVRWEDGRDRIEVEFGTSQEPVIQVYEDDELEGYKKEAAILATDIDNARAIQELLKKIIPDAKAAWEEATALPNTYSGLLSWVSTHIGEVEVDDERYQQSWGMAGEHPSRIFFEQQVTDARDDDRLEYEFDLVDLNKSAIVMDVRGKEAFVKVGTTSRLKYIQVRKNQDPAPYEDDFTIQCGDPEQAQLLAYALRKVLPMAKDQSETELPTARTNTAARQELVKALTDFRTGDYVVRQSISGDCRGTYNRYVNDEGRISDEVFELDLADLDAQSVVIDVNRTQLAVDVSTQKDLNFIYVTESGEQQNYEDKLEIPVPDIPTAKLVRHYLKQAIEGCPKEVKTMEWTDLQQVIADGSDSDEGFTQSVEQLEDSRCKWSLTQAKEDSRRSSEDRYELNLYDLNPREVEISVRGTSVFLKLETKRREEIIKVYSDGEDEGYERDVTLTVPNIAAAKQLQATIKAWIESCDR